MFITDYIDSSKNLIPNLAAKIKELREEKELKMEMIL
jgi:hypothetical protein